MSPSFFLDASTEWKIIYVLLAVVATLLVVIVVLDLVRLRQIKNIQNRNASEVERYKAITGVETYCRDLKAATERDAAARLVKLEEEVKEKEARLSFDLNVLQEKYNLLSTKHAAEEASISLLRATYAEKKRVFDQLQSAIAVLDEKYAFSEMGLYEPHFEFDDSTAYKAAIEAVRDRQKELISAKNAAVCTTKWSVDGSAAKGQTMTNRAIKITLRAFYGECDATIANVRWNNANAMIERIRRSAKQINGLNESNAVVITEPYVALKLDELRLTHEYREKLKQEREERAEASRAAREEAKLQRDLERAQDEEEYYEKMVAKAKAEAERATSEGLVVANEKMKALEAELEKAKARLERAQSLAERTRSGYVYVISNVGSFGPDVVKIGLTRRLDPSDRVRELGDASVPFIFDTHAIIYSDDAPSLERKLHSRFEESRINLQNYRKEFFRASIDAVREAVKDLAPEAPFFEDIEAQEYRETLSRRRQLFEPNPEAITLPDAI